MKQLFFTVVLLIVVFQSYSQVKQDYDGLKKRIEDKRLSIYQEYKSADSLKQDSLLKIADNFVVKILIDSIFPAWYNTPWDFNGHTTTPQKGKIACGYFITTTLNDAGFNIPRIKWAQMVSEHIIHKLTTDIKRFHKAQMSDIVKYINNKGNGLYIVGLDDHVGFISKQGVKLQFIHSSYYKPQTGVMAEPLIGWNPLHYSKYRIIGKILDNDMLRKWITGHVYQ